MAEPKKGDNWEGKALTANMKKFESQNPGKTAVFKGKVTGQYEYWAYWLTHEKPAPKPKGRPRAAGGKAPAKKKAKSKYHELTLDEVKELFARQYHTKGGASNVNTKTKRFEAFAAKMLEVKTT